MDLKEQIECVLRLYLDRTKHKLVVDSVMNALSSLIEERDALRADLAKQQSLTEAAQKLAEIAQRRADHACAKLEALKQQEPFLWYDDETGETYTPEIILDCGLDKIGLRPLYAALAHKEKKVSDIVYRLKASLNAGYGELRKEAALEIEKLRAEIERMEQQEPVGWYSKQYGFVFMSRQHQFENGSTLYLQDGTPALKIEGRSKIALLDMAQIRHGTVFYALPGAQGEKE